MTRHRTRLLTALATTTAVVAPLAVVPTPQSSPRRCTALNNPLCATLADEVPNPHGTSLVKVERKAVDGTWQALGETNLVDEAGVAIKIAGDVPVASTTVPLSDVVSVSKASYDGSGLTVSATSSDPAVDLTVVGYGPLAGGNAVFGGVTGPLGAPQPTFTAPAGQYELSLVAIGETGRSAPLAVPVRVAVADVVPRGPAWRRRCSAGPT